MKNFITSEWDGKLLRDYLKYGICVSSRQLSRLKRTQNGIMLNGENVTVRKILHKDDILELATEDTDEDLNENLVPKKMALDIVYEDEHIIVVNKPAFMPTHPSHNHYLDSLANGLAYYYAEKKRNFVFRAVNRLDVDTSGLVLVAKDKDSAYRLSKELIENKIVKKYYAVLCGNLPCENGIIEGYIKRKEASIILRCVCQKDEQGAAYALTKYREIERREGLSFVEAEPVTGRTHQLRVHFSSLGCPIAGDDMYGGIYNGELARQALHAHYLSIVHPYSGERIEFRAELSDDIREFLKKHNFSSII